MAKGISKLNQILGNRAFGQAPIGEMIVGLGKFIPRSFQLIQLNIERYGQVPEIASAIQKAPMASQLQTINDIFPSFSFLFSSQLRINPTFHDLAKNLLLADIGTTVARQSPYRSHIRLFLKNIDPSVDIYAQKDKTIHRNDGETYIPKLVNWDLILIGRNLVWNVTQNRNELIENLYAIRGLAQIFLRYHFDLLCAVEKDVEAKHVNDIFENFFITFRFQEMMYWSRYSGADKIQQQLEQIIEKDSPKFRHPILRKHCFDQLMAYHPMVHHGGKRRMTASTQKNLQDQLTAFRSFSLPKLTLFLRTLLAVKDPNYGIYLLTQLSKTSPGKLFQFKEYLEAHQEGDFSAPQLLSVLDPIIGKLPQRKTVFLDQDTQRQRTAKENIEKRPKGKSITGDDARAHIRKYLDRLYNKSRKSGALTQDGIADYLASLSTAAEQVVMSVNLSQEEKMVFEESVTDTLATFENISSEEMQDFQEAIQEEMKDLETPDLDARLEKVEAIGNVVAAAAEMSEIKKDAEDEEAIYQEACRIELNIHTSPPRATTVGNFLDLPIAMKEKLQFLTSYVPDPITPKMRKVIETVQYRSGKSSSNPVAIYRNGNLLKKALLRLLYPQHPFKELLQKDIIPILCEVGRPKISVRDFFTFPLGHKDGPPDDQWFAQHIYYLDLAKDEGELWEEDYEAIIENLDNFPRLEYKKYYNIIEKSRLEETAFMAVFGLWRDNGLLNLRIT